jgi:phage shock protein PspC (stress-responsive transcriptional regulator)
MTTRRLTRSRNKGTLAGVCAGLADYFGVDVVLVRLLWVIGSIAGAIIGGVIAYVVAWIIMPEGVSDELPAAHDRRLRRSTTDRQIAGVCGGMAEYFETDATLVRLIWVVLSIFGGAVIGGVIAYALAWLIIPNAEPLSMTRAGHAPPMTPAGL